VFSSLNIIWEFKSRKMKWVGHVVCVGEKNNACWVLAENPEENKSLGRSRHRWEDSIGGILKQDRRAWTGFIWLRIGISGRLL
jgi:hypothetical protein